MKPLLFYKVIDCDYNNTGQWHEEARILTTDIVITPEVTNYFEGLGYELTHAPEHDTYLHFD